MSEHRWFFYFPLNRSGKIPHSENRRLRKKAVAISTALFLRPGQIVWRLRPSGILISHKLLFRFEVKREMENQNTECPQPPDDL
ncbi:hypothetical protein, partial [Paenibacillus brasilensis]